MEVIHVVTTTPLSSEWREKIAALGPHLRVHDASELIRAELCHERSQEGPLPGEKADELLAQAEVLFARYIPPRLLARAPNLRWIHLFGTGVEHLEGSGILESPVSLTNARGVQALAIAEHALMFMLMFAKHMPQLMSSQQQRQWQRLYPTSLAGKTAGILGLGSIGREVARLARACHMRVGGTRRRTQERNGGGEEVDFLYSPGELPRLLTESDFVVVTVPLTTETRKMVGGAELRAMKPTAYIINVSRGGVIDEAALVTALRQGWIAGAGLDVTEREPLPPESPLWDMPNVIITPHIAGATDVYNDRSAALFYENLKRYVAGLPLLTVVDKNAGY